MALDSYSSLKSAVADWLQGRTDILTVIDDCIDLAEADFNHLFRVRDMEANTTLTPDANGEATLPADYLAWRTVTALDSPRRELEYITPSYLEDQFGDRTSGLASFFTIRASTMTVVPLMTGGTVRLDYYQRIPALSDSQTSNWLLAGYPAIYLYQTLKHAAVYLDADALAQKYASLANASISALEADDNSARFTRASARVSGPTP